MNEITQSKPAEPVERHTKQVSQLDADGYFLFPVDADESPLETGVFIIPGGAVDCPPPQIQSGERAKFDGEKFIIEPIPAPVPEPEPAEPTPEEIARAVTARRGMAYQTESDPIFFKAQRGEATVEEWLAKVEEIKARFPDGVMPILIG